MPKRFLFLWVIRDQKPSFLASHSAINTFLSILFFLNSHFLTPPLLEQISSHDIGVAFCTIGIGVGSGNGAGVGDTAICQLSILL